MSCYLDVRLRACFSFLQCVLENSERQKSVFIVKNLTIKYDNTSIATYW